MTICAVNCNVEWTVEDEVQVLRDIHEGEKARHNRHRNAMKKEKKFVHELERKEKEEENTATNFWRYCKRPFAHHKRDERVDHRVLQADGYPIRTQLQEMYEDKHYEEEAQACVELEDQYYEDMYEFFRDDYESDDYYDDCYDDYDRFFWGDEEEYARLADEAILFEMDVAYEEHECPISEEVMMMEMDMAYREMMQQEVSECYDLAMEELHEEMQLEGVEYAAMMEHGRNKTLKRRHRKANIREKGYIAMLNEKVNSRAKEEGRKPENFRRQSKRPHSRRFEERVKRHSRVDHRTACANAYPVAVQLRDMYEEMCA
ncbi:MAG: hypothetical protein J6B87_04780 [Clostridia bacterium]|nr:hypothetical protein [Clostridia bacterium]